LGDTLTTSSNDAMLFFFCLLSLPFLPPLFFCRLKFSLNPFSMIKQFVGPKVCCYCMCVLACAAFVLLMIYAGPVLNLMITLLLA
jgi:hypothetical protein